MDPSDLVELELTPGLRQAEAEDDADLVALFRRRAWRQFFEYQQKAQDSSRYRLPRGIIDPPD